MTDLNVFLGAMAGIQHRTSFVVLQNQPFCWNQQYLILECKRTWCYLCCFSPSSCGQKAVKEFELRLNRKVLEVWSCSYLPLLCACIHHPSQQRSTGCHHGLQSQSASEQKKNHMPPPLNFGSERGCCGRSTLDFSWLSFDILILKPSPRILH